MTKQPDPIQVCSELPSARSYHFHKLGEGPWTGTVYTAEGAQFEVEEIRGGWKVTDETGRSFPGKSLAVALGKAGIR